MTNEHFSNEQLQLLVDDELPVSEAAAVKEHLRLCRRCNAVYVSLSKLDSALLNLPMEHLGSDFTRNVLTKLHIVPKIPFLFRVVENLAYVFGLMMVLGVMLAAFVLTGVISSEQISQTKSSVGETSGMIADKMNSIIDALTVSLQSYLPFVFGGGSLKIAAMGTFVVGMLALLDRFLKRRLLR
ncbi:MAG: zf-HC2 domain-containing protein [Bacteroidota bacterium]